MLRRKSDRHHHQDHNRHHRWQWKLTMKMSKKKSDNDSHLLCCLFSQVYTTKFNGNSRESLKEWNSWFTHSRWGKLAMCKRVYDHLDWRKGSNKLFKLWCKFFHIPTFSHWEINLWACAFTRARVSERKGESSFIQLSTVTITKMLHFLWSCTTTPSFFHR